MLLVCNNSEVWHSSLITSNMIVPNRIVFEKEETRRSKKYQDYLTRGFYQHTGIFSTQNQSHGPHFLKAYWLVSGGCRHRDICQTVTCFRCLRQSPYFVWLSNKQLDAFLCSDVSIRQKIFWSTAVKMYTSIPAASRGQREDPRCYVTLQLLFFIQKASMMHWYQ